MGELKLGINLWSQATDWASFLGAAGGRTSWATTTSGPGTTCRRSSATRTSRSSRATRRWPRRAGDERARLGLFVGANTFRNPGLAAKAITTIDHISGGRAVMGLGGAWFGRSTSRSGSTSAAGSGSARLAGRSGADRPRPARRRRGHARPERATRSSTCASSAPVQAHVPVMIGGAGSARRCGSWPGTRTCGTSSGRRRRWPTRTRSCARTARTSAGTGRDRATARLQDHDPLAPRPRRSASGAPPRAQPDAAVAGRRRRLVLDRDARADRETMIGYRKVGFDTFIVELPAPYDDETMETLITVVKPMVSPVAR